MLSVMEIRSTSSLSNTSTPSSIYMDDDTMRRKWLTGRARMHKVSPQLQMNKVQYNNETSLYNPISVSLGPYHHGKEDFRRAEEFKYLCLHRFAGESDERKAHLYELVVENVNEIRDCYAEDSVLNRYEDNDLSQMMLLDACFIINFMLMSQSDDIAKDSYNCLGVAAALSFAARDIMLLENQIPFFILKLLLPHVMVGISSQEKHVLGTEGGKSLLASFLIVMLSVEQEHVEIPLEDQLPPLHILEACRRVLIGSVVTEKYSVTQKHGLDKKKYVPDSMMQVRDETRLSLSSIFISLYDVRKRNTNSASKGNPCYTLRSSCHIRCPSVMYLKAKGIYFRPSTSHHLNDITFTSHAFSGLLQLPVCYVSDLTFVFLSNMIAYEIAPHDNVLVSPDLTVLSYICFMKSLIQTPADVIELQEKGMLRLNRYANHEQVIQLFKSIDTFGLRNVNIYQDVMHKLGDHCDNKAKTWMADLIYGKLNNPWTITALLSATLLLIFSFIQTYYVIPKQH